MKKLLALFTIGVISLHCNSQSYDSTYFGVETNINFANKTRSYGTPEGSKFTTTRFFFGWDFSAYYSTKSYQFGIEYFPYKHLNLFVGKEVFRYKKFRIIPNIKYGYSFDLKKQYTGVGIKLNLLKLNLNITRTLHFKSGDSKYWGDGIFCVSVGYTFNPHY